jgi:hypothetical protein
LQPCTMALAGATPSPQGARVWEQSPRASSPLQQMLSECREFASSPDVHRRRPSPNLDPRKLPFDGHGDAADELGTGPPRRLPSLTMEEFGRMKERERESLNSRSSDPGAGGGSRNGSRSKRRHRHSNNENASGSKSAPASRGTDTSEPLLPWGMPEAPLTEPADRLDHRRTSPSPLMRMRPHSTVNLGGMTPMRCSSAASLGQGGSSKRPPHLPKRGSAIGSRGEQDRRVDDLSPSCFQFPGETGDESPLVASPLPYNSSRVSALTNRQQRNSSSYPSPPNSGRSSKGGGYNTTNQAPAPSLALGGRNVGTRSTPALLSCTSPQAMPGLPHGTSSTSNASGSTASPQCQSTAAAAAEAAPTVG